MSAVTTPARPGFGQTLSDINTIVWRNLINIRRNPELLVFSTIQPVIFVLLFRYVFGGAIKVPGVDRYVDFLMPGIFAQTVAFGSINTGIGLAEDLNKGLIERFQSLPMARSAVLVGRTAADLARNVFVTGLMVAVGFLVGFRYHAGLGRFLLGLLILLLFGFALSWIFATVGLAIGSAEATQAASFPLMAPLVFASTAFVAVSTMPGWLQPWARNQPVSVVVAAMRRLVLGNPSSAIEAAALGGGGSTTTVVVKSVLWCVGIVLVFAPLAVTRYRKAK